MPATILVVEDDPVFSAELTAMLTEAGYRVEAANDGEAALAVIERLRGGIDLIIVDLVLPKSSGFEVIGAVVRRPTGIKIIATTAILKDLYMDVAGEIGAHATIRKPERGAALDKGQWLTVVRKLLHTRAAIGTVETGGTY